MVSGLQSKRVALNRKLQIQRTLGRIKSVTAMDALLHIFMLKLKLEAVQREYQHLMALKAKYIDLIKNVHQVPKEVKVEKIEEGFVVRVRCEKKEDTLVSILEAFEEMGLNVLHARVSCNDCFSMEAIAAAAADQNPEHHQLDVRDVRQVLIRATKIDNQDAKETHDR